MPDRRGAVPRARRGGRRVRHPSGHCVPPTHGDRSDRDAGEQRPGASGDAEHIVRRHRTRPHAGRRRRRAAGDGGGGRRRASGGARGGLRPQRGRPGRPSRVERPLRAVCAAGADRPRRQARGRAPAHGTGRRPLGADRRSGMAGHDRRRPRLDDGLAAGRRRHRRRGVDHDVDRSGRRLRHRLLPARHRRGQLADPGMQLREVSRLGVARHLAHRPHRRSAAADRSDDRHGRRHDRRLGDLRRGAPRGTRRRISRPCVSPRISATRLGFEPAADAVAGGPLAGWQTFPGEGSLLLSGPTGATWTLSDGVAVFTWSGRW